MKGVYQHCKGHHLQRYLHEFDFRYNTKDCSDLERSAMLLEGFKGKRLSYWQSH
jgi:hypothetical protein